MEIQTYCYLRLFFYILVQVYTQSVVFFLAEEFLFLNSTAKTHGHFSSKYAKAFMPTCICS